jgi:hypothetical protein
LPIIDLGQENDWQHTRLVPQLASAVADVVGWVGVTTFVVGFTRTLNRGESRPGTEEVTGEQ